MIGLDRLCDPSTLSRKSLSDVKFALDKYIPDPQMTDSSMKNIFVEAVGAFYIYEKVYFLYRDCFLHSFQSIVNREEQNKKQEKEGKSTAKKFLRLEAFKKILEIAEANKEEYPKLLKLKDIMTSYHYGLIKKIVFANNNTAPHLEEMLSMWGLKTEIVKGGKGTKRIARLKSGDLDCLIFTSEPKVKIEIERTMIIHYLMPKNKNNMKVKNECNGSVAPEYLFYIYMEHFLDWRKLKMTQNRPKSPKKKKGQGTLDLWS